MFSSQSNADTNSDTDSIAKPITDADGHAYTNANSFALAVSNSDGHTSATR